MVSLFAVLVSIFAIVYFTVGVQQFEILVAQKDPIAIGTILAIVVTVLAMAHKLGWAQSWIPAK